MTAPEQSVALYAHAGSGNHGCEALAYTLIRQLSGSGISPVRLLTNSREEDMRYGVGSLAGSTGGVTVEVEEERHLAAHLLDHILYYGYRKLTGDRESFLRYRFAPATGRRKPVLALSIGGDNYCYPDMVGDLILSNSMFNHQGTATALIGCSVEPELFGSEKIRRDMADYRLITARESRTFEALLQAGIPREKVRLIPDPAFTLPAAPCGLPEGFVPERTVGVNLSPLVNDYAGEKNIVFDSVLSLIRHILETTDLGVLLIPHVIWDRSNDFTPLNALYSRFREGPYRERVAVVPDGSASVLKGIISRCSMFIGARTHATIAAYSSLVPTLVIGYSVKATGIAEDIFGSAEHHVVPVQTLENAEELVDAFEYIRENSGGIKKTLGEKMPEIRRQAGTYGRLVKELLESLPGDGDGTRG